MNLLALKAICAVVGNAADRYGRVIGADRCNARNPRRPMAAAAS